MRLKLRVTKKIINYLFKIMKQIDKQLFRKVNDGFNYFNDFRLEELKEDDQYYLNSFMAYIIHLENIITKK